MSTLYEKCHDSDDDDFYVAQYIEEPYDPNKIPMYCKNQVYCNGQEYSLEEIRSRRYLIANTNNDRQDSLKVKEINNGKQPLAESFNPAKEEMLKGVKKKCPALLDSVQDKENYPDIRMHPLLANTAKCDKTFSKDNKDKDALQLDDEILDTRSSILELDVTGYTKAFNLPEAISTPGPGSGKFRNVKGSGSETKVLKKGIIEKLDNEGGGPVAISSELSTIEETSRECTSGSSDAASAATLASDKQNPGSTIKNLYRGPLNNISSRMPTMLGSKTMEIPRTQVSRIPCSVIRSKPRSTATGDFSKDLDSMNNTSEKNETIEINSKTISVRSSNKNILGEPMEEICKQMEVMNIALDPFEQKQIDYFLSHLQIPISNRIGYYSVPQKIPVVKNNSDFHLRKEARDGGHLFKNLKVVGQGAYARVYKALSVKWKRNVALKVQKPPCPWEFYISHEIHSRMTDHIMKNSFMNIKEACFFNDGSILISDFMEYGTLLDIINLYKTRRIRIPESLAIYLTLDILRIINSLHSCKIIHADIKPDNFLLMKLPQINEDFSSFGQTTLQLIDLGRCIDMALYPPNTCFDAVFQKKFFQCTEMRSKKQWTYQVDMFHIASLVHTIVFGDFMDVTFKDGVWSLTKKLPRNLNQDLWNWFFNLMLNVESCTKLPNLEEVIKKMQREFLDNMLPVFPSAVGILRKYFNEDKAKSAYCPNYQ